MQTSTTYQNEAAALGIAVDSFDVGRAGVTVSEENAGAVADELTAKVRALRAQAATFEALAGDVRRAAEIVTWRRCEGAPGEVLRAAALYCDAVALDAYEQYTDTEPRECSGPCMDPDPEPTPEERRAAVLRTVGHLHDAAEKAEGEGRPSTAAALVALAEALREVPERETDAWQIRRGQSAAFEAALLLMSWGEA